MIEDEILDGMGLDEACDYLMHYGTKYHSGRYPYGSGDDPYQHDGFYERVVEMKKRGLSQVEQANELGISTTMLRAQWALISNKRKADAYDRAKQLRESGQSFRTIATDPQMQELGYSRWESVRSLLGSGAKEKVSAHQNLVDILRKEVDEKKMVDVGKGVDAQLGVNKEQMRKALTFLKAEGYEVITGSVSTGKGKETVLQALAVKGTPQSAIYQYENVKNIGDDYKSHDGGVTFTKPFRYPASMDPKRLQIKYAEDGGTDRDGLVELRRGVKDLSLGKSNYAQVRILVGGDRYIKGMAVYSDDLPEGVDVRFNVKYTKADKPTWRDVLKKIKNDPDNPFGSLIKEDGGQSEYEDDDGNKKLSLINKRGDAGDWNEWGTELPTQFLAKQSKGLITSQLNTAKELKQSEFDEIMDISNPVVRKKYLEDFAGEMDSASVHMKGAALPRQRYQVILPIPSLKDNEVYAPNFNDGEEVALIRFPHQGTFEIPILRVNNRNPEGIKMLGKNPPDAVGINGAVASRLSGADYDGDTVMVLPTNNGQFRIQSRPQLEKLIGFNEEMDILYGADTITTDSKGNEHYFRNGKEFKHMKNTGQEMGKITNLITDMTVVGAPDDEVARAVKHAMIVIDAAKHNYDYEQSYKDNNIAELKRKYQKRIDPVTGEVKYGGATTIFSRAKSPYYDERHQGSSRIDKETGELIFKKHRDTYETISVRDENGKWVKASPEQKHEYYEKKKNGDDLTGYKVKVNERNTKIPSMSAVKDAHELSSGYFKEEMYADYANWLKALANKARLESTKIKTDIVNKKATDLYSTEVDSLLAKLRAVELNAPRERRAQMMTETEIKRKKEVEPDISEKDLGKLRQQALNRNRALYGSRRKELAISITDKEWEALESGALSATKFSQIIQAADPERLRYLAQPNSRKEISPATKNRILNYANSNYTNSQIAAMLGISTSTISKILTGKEE